MSTKNKFILFITISWLITLLIACCQYNEYKNKYNEMIDYIKTIEDGNKEEECIDVLVTDGAEIKKEPNVNSETIGVYYWNTKLTVIYINDSWAQIKETEQYINREFISENMINYVDCDVPSNNTIKSYMDYRTITSKSSRQYKLQDSCAYTNEYGLRMVDDRYCVALGSYYTTTIGQYVDIELENGVVIKGILADCKSDKHTDSTNRINPNGSVVEFVVETESLERMPRIMGDISYANNWNSKVVNIKVYNKIKDF